MRLTKRTSVPKPYFSGWELFVMVFLAFLQTFTLDLLMSPLDVIQMVNEELPD
ncbi:MULTISPECIES: hypothetical protein [Niastella]|uniref:MFS transporter n=1 Tax=Niastella soli TaxID=2821487 RepID=A0ABS3YVD7_9BACT|nr:hypothetical protein [Niastella soli]MBO9201131.1 hypothetical protein [Niastella soli]